MAAVCAACDGPLTDGLEFIGDGVGPLCSVCIRKRAVPPVESEIVLKACEDSDRPIERWCPSCLSNAAKREAAKQKTLFTRLTHRATNIERCERSVGSQRQIEAQMVRRRHAMGMSAPRRWDDGFGRAYIPSREEMYEKRSTFGPGNFETKTEAASRRGVPAIERR